jgi:hypothetical protein
VIVIFESTLQCLGRYWMRAVPLAKRAGTNECGSC